MKMTADFGREESLYRLLLNNLNYLLDNLQETDYEIKLHVDNSM